MPKSLVLSMPYSSQTFAAGIVALTLIGSLGIAEAQITPGGFGGPAGGQQQGEENKKEGVAEAAPKTPGLLPTTPALPPAKGRRKKWKLFELDGYYRMRTDWFKNFNLGFSDDPALGGAPFPRPISCGNATTECEGSLSSTNMRLRLEPTLNIDEGTSVHVQADIYDNLVLGSTPSTQDLSAYTATNLPPLGAFGNTQDPTIRGVNSDRDAITIKRAWAEIAVPLGIVKLGRQPNHWGMGVLFNAGGYDPIAGTYDYDADLGDTVDRLSFSALIPGTDLRAMIASDWVSTRLVSNQASQGKGRESHPWDLSDHDDADTIVAVISRMDSPQEFRDIVDRGEVAFNYGVYFEYKTQENDLDLTDYKLGGTLDAATKYVPRGYKTYTPDVWVKLGLGHVQLEGEVAAILGKIDHLEDFGITNPVDIRKFGGAGRFIYKALDGKLRLGVESGFASGDQWDNNPQGATHISHARLLGDPAMNATLNKLTQFFFNREYKVDMILWRHLYGAITNAAYAKPFLSYDLTKSIVFKAANITSFAVKTISTPGNSSIYGTEFNADLGYTAGGINIGASYGVLFPLGALAHPATDSSGTVDPLGYGSNVGDGSTAHTIQFRAILAF
jgi:uncharacterized protein (TIGR04551 family)